MLIMAAAYSGKIDKSAQIISFIKVQNNCHRCCGSGRRANAAQCQDCWIIHRLSVRQSGCRTCRKCQYFVSCARFRIDRYGIKLFCAGVGPAHPDITNASCRLKASEFKTCATNGVTPITEIAIDLDGIALATAKSTVLAHVTEQELYYTMAKMPFGKPNPTKTWKDVSAKYPAIPIRFYGPPTTSGT
jgi:PBP superfamily domain